jgi:hypothetical protein
LATDLDPEAAYKSLEGESERTVFEDCPIG